MITALVGAFCFITGIIIACLCHVSKCADCNMAQIEREMDLQRRLNELLPPQE